jgi:hypothetical protein
VRDSRAGKVIVRRLRRWLWNGSAALSLVLCALMVVLWVRSYGRFDQLQLWHQTGAGLLSRWSAVSVGGLLMLQHPVESSGVFSATPEGWSFHRVSGSPRQVRRNPGLEGPLGFHCAIRQVSPSLRISDLFFPYWFAVGCFLAAPAIWFKRYWGQRSRRGVCPVCGYDLRASPNRCPECGTPVEPSPKA